MFLKKINLPATLNALKTGKLSLLAYINEICGRIDEVDPHLHCFLPEPDRKERLMADAQTLLKNYPDAVQRPPLFGLLVGVKDIIRVDGFATACGSKLPSALFAGKEAAIVTQLKNAGALIAGKTHTTEFAWFNPGPTRNPHNTGHTPGGSSSGSAAAVAAGLVPVAFGTQTIGSVIRPAAYCGLIGVKPGKNSLPNDGIIPFSKTFDQLGFFTQDLEGAAFISSVLCREWMNEPQTPEAPSTNSLVLDHKIKNKQASVGIPHKNFLNQAEAEILDAFDLSVNAIRNAGLRLVETKLFENIDEINKRHKALAAKEFSEVHKKWFAQYGHLYSRQSADLIHEGRMFDPGMIREVHGHTQSALFEIERIMADEGIDVWISPAATSLPPQGLSSTGSPLMNLPWTFTGVPCMTVPVNKPKLALPHGLQISGRTNGLKDLFAHAEILVEILQ